jgi:hypothetical protein
MSVEFHSRTIDYCISPALINTRICRGAHAAWAVTRFSDPIDQLAVQLVVMILVA